MTHVRIERTIAAAGHNQMANRRRDGL